MTQTFLFFIVNGNGHTLDGQGASYWDGQGTGGGVTKPAPLLRINHSGTFTNLKVANSPARAIAIGGSSLTVSDVTVDDCRYPFFPPLPSQL
jgi:polygalacturonase